MENKINKITKAEVPFPFDSIKDIGEKLSGLKTPKDKEKDEFIFPACPDKTKITDTFNSYPEINGSFSCWYNIRKLGVGVNIHKDGIRLDSLPDEYRQISSLLLSGEKAFSIVCASNKKDASVDLKLGTMDDSDGEYTNSLLSSSFGLVDLEKADNTVPGKVRWYADCTPVKLDIEALDKSVFALNMSSWVDAAASSVIMTDCSAGVEFYPASDTNWINGTLDTLYKHQRMLNDYLKHHPTVSYSDADNCSDTYDPKILKDVENLGTATNKLLYEKLIHRTFGNSKSVSVSNEYITNDPEMERLDAELRYRISLLEHAKNNGWMIRMTVTGSDQNDNTAAAVRAALGAALTPLGFSCRWHLDNEHSTEKAGLILPSHMAAPLVSFPIKPFAGFVLEHRSNLNINPPVNTDNSDNGIKIGTILWNCTDTKKPLHIERKYLNRHMAVFGMTGSGKTTTVCNIAESLDDIHFLAVEPVKGEYHSIPGTKTYSMTLGAKNTLKFNPFWFPKGSSVSYHIGSLKLIISSAFDMYAAMPNILDQCLSRVYVNCGWNLASSQNIYSGKLPEEELYPTFDTLCREVEAYLVEIGFDGESASAYRGAMLARLKNFTTGPKGLLLNNNNTVPFDEWYDQNIVIELDALSDDADKAIVMGALMIQYFQYVKYIKYRQKKHGESDILKHMFILEEAHHLFCDNNSLNGQNSGSSNQLVNMLNVLLAEIREYGEGFMIIDQSPSSVSKSVLKNTAVKIVHHIEYGEDIELLRSALLLEKDDNIPTSLETGQALVRFGTMQSPIHINITRYNKKDEAGISHVEVDPAECNDVQDRILSSKPLMEQLQCLADKLMNQMLFTSDRNIIEEAYKWYKDETYRNIRRSCGSDVILSNPDSDYYRSITNTCIIRSAEKSFPGQYCLHRMIRMYIMRIVDFLDEGGIKDAGLNEKVWDILLDYRYTHLYNRISEYTANDTDVTVKLLTAIIGPVPETKIVKPLVDELWNISPDDTERYETVFHRILDNLFCITPSIETVIYLKEIVKHYCNSVSEL